MQTPSQPFGIKRNQHATEGLTSSSHKRGLQAAVASTPEHNRRKALACAPTANVCYRVSPKPLETRHNTAAGSALPETLASSGWPTPPRDSAPHDHSRGRSCLLSFF